MTVPICHGAAGGCIFGNHSADCPVMLARVVSHAHAWMVNHAKGISECPCGARACGVPFTPPTPATCTCDVAAWQEHEAHKSGCPALRFTPPTKRTVGQCHGTDRGCTMAIPSCEWTHTPDCPALHPLQPQPGDTRDALTRLVAHVRGIYTDVWQEAALDLISEAREEQARAREVQFGLRMIAETKALHCEQDLAKTMDALLTTQKTMGEARQQAFRDMAAEMEHMDGASMGLYVHRILLGVKESE